MAGPQANSTTGRAYEVLEGEDRSVTDRPRVRELDMTNVEVTA